MQVSFFAIFVVLAAAGFVSVFFGLTDRLFFCFKRLSLLSVRVIHCYQGKELLCLVIECELFKSHVLTP